MPKPAPQTWTAQRLRTHLAFDVAAWARVLGVSPITIQRWEAGSKPSGMAAEVFRGVAAALDAGVPATTVHNRLSLGLATLLRANLTDR